MPCTVVKSTTICHRQSVEANSLVDSLRTSIPDPGDVSTCASNCLAQRVPCQDMGYSEFFGISCHQSVHRTDGSAENQSLQVESLPIIGAPPWSLRFPTATRGCADHRILQNPILRLWGNGICHEATEPSTREPSCYSIDAGVG